MIYEKHLVQTLLSLQWMFNDCCSSSTLIRFNEDKVAHHRAWG